MQTNGQQPEASGAEREATLNRLKLLNSPDFVFAKAEVKALAREHWAGFYVRIGDTGAEGVDRFARHFPFRWADDDDRYEVLSSWAAEFMDNQPIDLAEWRRKMSAPKETVSRGEPRKGADFL